jgi:hypothetical protein
MVRLPLASKIRLSVHSTSLCALAIAAALTGACSQGGEGDSGEGGGGGSSTSGGAGTTGAAGQVASTGNGGSTGAAGTTGAAGQVVTTGKGGTTGAAGSSSGVAGTTGAAGQATTGKGGATGAAGTTGAAGSGPAGSSGGGSTGSGSDYNPNFKEFYGDDCTVADPKDVMVSGQLPDLFQKLDGTKIAKKSDWKCRRAELKKVVEKYIHGAKPAKPEKVTGTVSSSSIKVHVENGGKSIDFSVSVSLPSGASGPVPLIIGMGGSSLDSSIVKAEGVASGTYDHQAMASETSRSGLFTNIYGSTGASAQIGWAWGISRVIDVLVDEKAAGRNNIIDPTAIGITGCSRNGKAAFNVGAFDERIALGIPQESGTGGVSAFRIVNTGVKGPNGMPAQSLDSAWSEAQGWFGTTFGTYRSKVDTIPGDTHSIVGMYIPRGLLVLDNSRIGELCASCQHAASAAGQKVYDALGIGKNIGYNGGNPSDPHNHCTFYANTQGDPLKRAIRGHLTKKMAPDGRMEPQPAGTADLTKWVPWTAPTLTDDQTWGAPPLTAGK